MKGSRFTEKYLAARYQPTRYSPITRPSTIIKPVSPPRKVVSSFAAFEAKPAAHPMFGAQPTPTFGSPQKGGRMTFGGIRGGGIDDEEEDDSAPIGAIGLANGSITLDQVRVSIHDMVSCP